MCDISEDIIIIDDKTNNASLESTTSLTEHNDENANITDEEFNHLVNNKN